MAIRNPFADQNHGLPPFICNGYPLPRCNNIAADDFETNLALKWETYVNKKYIYYVEVKTLWQMRHNASKSRFLHMR